MEWRDVVGFDGYLVNENGEVYSTKRNKILQANELPSGYMRLHLMKNHKPVHVYVHRVVAEAFIPNPNNLPEVNHRDENKANNHVSNLEFCTHAYNVNFGTCIERRTAKINKKVNQYSLDGEFIKTWDSLAQAARALGIQLGSISNCCRGKSRSSQGYKWSYAEGDKSCSVQEN